MVISQVSAVKGQTSNGTERVSGHGRGVVIGRRKLNITQGADAGIDTVNQSLQRCHIRYRTFLSYRILVISDVSTVKRQTTNRTERVSGHGRGVVIGRRKLNITQGADAGIDTVDERLKRGNISNRHFGCDGLQISIKILYIKVFKMQHFFKII
ncbi:hypothetical protein VTH8203_03315 [Vibrio thalassae]|uniref:Uncharacterized protein n=1 Tax=Vibrio thalassae TaxID=1243014 RepID=A0A240ELU6_9VIBR|nr:hypothetical protein VTH8203_03315 [Vibrio thalassae]